jgi:hypothetical protein
MTSLLKAVQKALSSGPASFDPIFSEESLKSSFKKEVIKYGKKKDLIACILACCELSQQTFNEFECDLSPLCKEKMEMHWNAFDQAVDEAPTKKIEMYTAHELKREYRKSFIEFILRNWILIRIREFHELFQKDYLLKTLALKNWAKQIDEGREYFSRVQFAPIEAQVFEQQIQIKLISALESYLQKKRRSALDEEAFEIINTEEPIEQCKSIEKQVSKEIENEIAELRKIFNFFQEKTPQGIKV